jgi:hypothetical protein
VKNENIRGANSTQGISLHQVLFNPREYTRIHSVCSEGADRADGKRYMWLRGIVIPLTQSWYAATITAGFETSGLPCESLLYPYMPNSGTCTVFEHRPLVENPRPAGDDFKQGTDKSNANLMTML